MLSAEFVLHVPLEYDYLYTSPRRKSIIKSLQIYYQNAKVAQLPIYGVPNIHLKAFRTSASDKKKGISKIPNKAFLLSKYGIYDTSELVSEPAIKLIENEISGSLYQRNMKEREMKLTDFTVLKQIGKGSFG